MDDNKFASLKDLYDQYTNGLLAKGQLPLRSTEKGFWNAAIADEVYQAFKDMKVGRYKKFVDLGSGDGRVALIASLFGPHAEGVEIDEELHKVATHMQNQLKIENAAFHCKDFFDHHVGAYDLVFMNPDVPFHRGAEDKLLGEIKGDVLVMGHHFLPQYLKQKAQTTVNGSLFTLFSKY